MPRLSAPHAGVIVGLVFIALHSNHYCFILRLAPQVRVVDGRIELDMDSLTVDHDIVDAVEDQGPMEYVEESALTKFVNSSSYSTKLKSEKWSEEDTERFYEVCAFSF